MVPIVFFSTSRYYKCLQKGAKGLVIATVTLTGRAYACSIGY